MSHSRSIRAVFAAAAAMSAVGCASPYYADRGAALGGLTGAGVGWAVGDAVGHEAAGALIGTGVGALAGAAVGSGLDEVEAKNRAMIESQMGRQVAAGAVTINDVVTMSKAGVNEELIVNHIRSNGAAQTPTADDLIVLQQEGVATRVIAAMQAPPRAVVAAPAAAPVVVEEHYYAPYPPPYWRYRCRPRPCYRGGWGVSVGGPW